MRDRPILLGSLVVVLAASGFGLLGPLARFAYDAGFAPLSFVAWRAAFGTLVVLLVIAVRTRRGGRLVNPFGLVRADGIGLVVVALAGLGLNIAMFFGFGLTTVALVLLAFYTYPAMVAIVAVGLGHEQLDGTRWTALALALGGMVVVVAGSLGAGPGETASTPATAAAGSLVPIAAVVTNPLGIVLGLIAAVCQTVFVTVSRGRFTTVPSEQAMGWVLLVTAVACAGLAVLAGDAIDVPLRKPDGLFLAALTGIVAAGIPSILFLIGIRAIGGTRAGILMLIEPLVGVSLAALLLHEGLLPIQVAGGAAILAAALLLQRGAPPAEGIEPTIVPSAERT